MLTVYTYVWNYILSPKKYKSNLQTLIHCTHSSAQEQQKQMKREKWIESGANRREETAKKKKNKEEKKKTKWNKTEWCKKIITNIHSYYCYYWCYYLSEVQREE